MLSLDNPNEAIFLTSVEEECLPKMMLEGEAFFGEDDEDGEDEVAASGTVLLPR